MAPVKPAPTKRRTNLARKSATSGSSRKKPAGKVPLKMSKQVKTKPGSQTAGLVNKKKKKPVYTEKQLGLPVLNSIVPASAKVQHKAGGTGKKKNKIYVDDREGMMTILALVNAEKEGQIESKVAKERQMEEIREARRKEAEKREKRKEGKVEEVKEKIKGEKTARKKREGGSGRTEADGSRDKQDTGEKKRKRVSFA